MVRKKVVLAKGKLPCDVLFIGEAPGASEDILGRPFVGPAGHLLDMAINSALRVEEWRKHSPIRLGFTNLIACVPKELIYEELEDGEPGDFIGVGSKIPEPDKEYIEACAPRLQEFYEIASPTKVVCVGKLAEKWAPKILDVAIEDTIGVMHPAAILRMDISQKGLAYQRVVVQLEDLFDEFMEGR